MKSVAEYRPPPELEAFLAEGPAPVAVTFSSQFASHAGRLTEAVAEGLRLSGRRGLIVSGWGGLRPDRLPPGVIRVPTVPHDWLFPHVAGVVHHGGSGTTAAALRAGVPNVAVPFGYDQPLWGRQLARLCVGPEPLPSSGLTADALAGAIHRLVSDDTYRRRAAQVASLLRGEDGVANAVAVVHGLLPNGQK